MKSITRTRTLLARHNALKSSLRRTISDGSTTDNLREAWIYIDSLFPIRLAAWDLRHFIWVARRDSYVRRAQTILSSVDIPNFELLSVEPHPKDGGAFAKFRYHDLGNTDDTQAIEERLREHIEKKGGLPSWDGLGRGDVWLVKGRPWPEDMNRFASSFVRVAFDGPDVPEESLYHLFRPYGRISNLSSPGPVPAGTLRYSTIAFKNVHSATVAKNVLHGLQISTDKGVTRLMTGYERLQVHVFRDWVAKHPRIFLPIVFVLIGTLTYTIFDPIRIVMVEGRVMNWFDYRESGLYKWASANKSDRTHKQGTDYSDAKVRGLWQKDAENSVKAYLSDLPTTISFVHGPQGSEKANMVSEAVNSLGRKVLTIDCAAIFKHQDSEVKMVAALAQQTGYWPIFTFLDSLNKAIDLASVGIIGQKTGFSSSLADQLKEVLEVVSRSLGRVSAAYEDHVQHMIKKDAELMQKKERMRKVRMGEWHDGRLDCVAGNGVMSELGIGDEQFGENDWDAHAETEKENGEEKNRLRNGQDAEVVNGLPVVIIRNYVDKGGSMDVVLNALAQWAASLVQNQIAHVIVLSDNRESSKCLAKALPSKPLNDIFLYDDDDDTALSVVQQKLKDAGIEAAFTPQTTAFIQRLGGRSADLERLINQIRSGFSVEDAVEDIINKGVMELRKSAFGDDAEDAKTLPWLREQAWWLMKQFATQSELSYHDVLLSFPFNNDEMALKSMEHAELVTITTQNGRPATIRPGRPVYKYVFERLVEDTVFAATQDISSNKKLISTCEFTIHSCEEELARLADVGERTRSPVWGEDRAVRARIKYLLKKMGDAESKLEGLEKANARLAKVIAQR